MTDNFAWFGSIQGLEINAQTRRSGVQFRSCGPPQTRKFLALWGREQGGGSNHHTPDGLVLWTRVGGYLKPCSSWSPKSGSPQTHRLPGRSRQPSGFLWFNPFLQSTVGEISGQLHLAFFTLMHKARSIRSMTIGHRFHKPFTLVLADRQQQSTMIPWTSRLLLRA